MKTLYIALLSLSGLYILWLCLRPRRGRIWLHREQLPLPEGAEEAEEDEEKSAQNVPQTMRLTWKKGVDPQTGKGRVIWDVDKLRELDERMATIVEGEVLEDSEASPRFAASSSSPPASPRTLLEASPKRGLKGGAAKKDHDTPGEPEHDVFAIMRERQRQKGRFRMIPRDQRSDTTSAVDRREFIQAQVFEPPPACFRRGRKVEYWSGRYGGYIGGRIKTWYARTNTLDIAFVGHEGQRSHVPFSSVRPRLGVGDRCEVLYDNEWTRERGDNGIFPETTTLSPTIRSMGTSTAGGRSRGSITRSVVRSTLGSSAGDVEVFEILEDAGAVERELASVKEKFRFRRRVSATLEKRRRQAERMGRGEMASSASPKRRLPPVPEVPPDPPSALDEPLDQSREQSPRASDLPTRPRSLPPRSPPFSPAARGSKPRRPPLKPRPKPRPPGPVPPPAAAIFEAEPSFERGAGASSRQVLKSSRFQPPERKMVASFTIPALAIDSVLKPASGANDRVVDPDASSGSDSDVPTVLLHEEVVREGNHERAPRDDDEAPDNYRPADADGRVDDEWGDVPEEELDDVFRNQQYENSPDAAAIANGAGAEDGQQFPPGQISVSPTGVSASLRCRSRVVRVLPNNRYVVSGGGFSNLALDAAHVRRVVEPGSSIQFLDEAAKKWRYARVKQVEQLPFCGGVGDEELLSPPVVSFSEPFFPESEEDPTPRTETPCSISRTGASPASSPRQEQKRASLLISELLGREYSPSKREPASPKQSRSEQAAQKVLTRIESSETVRVGSSGGGEEELPIVSAAEESSATESPRGFSSARTPLGMSLDSRTEQSPASWKSPRLHSASPRLHSGPRLRSGVVTSLENAARRTGRAERRDSTRRLLVETEIEHSAAEMQDRAAGRGDDLWLEPDRVFIVVSSGTFRVKSPPPRQIPLRRGAAGILEE